MNQKQREFLMNRVQRNLKDRVDKLRRTLPKKPSLNNYLIASFLDNSIQFADMDTLKNKIRDRVRKLGTGETLTGKAQDTWSSRHDRTETEFVSMRAEDVFILPKTYIEAIKEYEKVSKKIRDEIKEIEAIAETLEIKVQIGSDKKLEEVIEQADNLADLDLFNTQLVLITPKKPKAIEKK